MNNELMLILFSLTLFIFAVWLIHFMFVRAKSKEQYIAIPISGRCDYLTIGKIYPISDYRSYGNDQYGTIISDPGYTVYERFKTHPCHLKETLGGVSAKWEIKRAHGR